MVLCSFCQKTCKTPKHCSVCKVAVYCGAKCQKLSWKKGHRHICKKVEEIGDTISHIKASDVLLMLPYVDAMLECRAYDDQILIISTFVDALRTYGILNGSKDHIVEIIPLEMRRAVLEGKQQMCRDQGDTLGFIAQYSMIIKNDEQAMEYFEKSRKVAETHGFFGIESRACRGIGALLIRQGRFDEGMDLLRNALAAAPLAEVDCSSLEAAAIETLLLNILGMPWEWDNTQLAEADTLTLRYCSVAEGMVRENPMPIESVGHNMFSYFLRTRFLWRCDDDVNAAAYLRKMLALFRDVSTEDDNDLYRRPCVQQAEMVLKHIEYQSFNTFKGIIADFQAEITRLTR